MSQGTAIAITILSASVAFGAETDNLTYRFLPLEDSAPKVNAVVNDKLETVVERANDELRREGRDPSAASDIEAELAFFRAYRRLALRRFSDRLLPIFEACIESDDCPGWPRFERIVLEGTESIYAEARYNRIAESSLAPTFELCGVRMGTDKMTHLFSNGFFYYNASRQEGSRLQSDDEVLRAALQDERGLMGARSTAVESPADAEATRAGYRLARDVFEGNDPIVGRDPESGLLARRREVDVCAYVSPGFDEVTNPPVFTAGKAPVARIRKAIAARTIQNETAERSMTEEEKRSLEGWIVSRRLPESHGKLPFFYKLYVALKWGVAYFTVPKGSREAIGYLVFPKFRLRGRRPIALRREKPAARSSE